MPHGHTCRATQTPKCQIVRVVVLLSVSGRYRTCLGGADLLRTVEPTFFTMEPTFCVPDIAEIMQAKERARGALVDPHAQLASPRAALRQAALEQLSELAPSLLMQHAPAIVARLEDRQMSVRRAALHALRRLPAAALFDYLPAILERLEDKDDEVRDSAQEVLERLDSASGLPPSSALQMRRLKDSDTSVRAIAVQALREGAALERLAPVLVRNLRRGRWVVRQGALEALAALTPMALASHMHEVACSMYLPMSPLSLSYISPISHMHEVACCMADTHTAVRLSALETLEQLEPFDLAEIAPRASPLINEANPLIVASALDLLARLAPEDLAPYADQINCCRFDQAADVRAAAQRALAKLSVKGV